MIPTPDEPQSIPRRSFAGKLALGVIALIVAALWGLREWFHSGKTSAQVIGRAGEIPVGGSAIFSYPRNDTPCILVRPSADTYIAFSRLCTHNSCPVSYNQARNEFDCPCHGGVFSATDGSVLAGPPPRPLPRIIVEQRGGNLLATGIAPS